MSVPAGAAEHDAEAASPRRANSASHLRAGRGRFYFSMEGPPAEGTATAAAAAAAPTPAALQQDALAAAAYVTSLTELGLTHAVYAHAWDAGGTRLAAAGGPLLCGARGCYAALWA